MPLLRKLLRKLLKTLPDLPTRTGDSWGNAVDCAGWAAAADGGPVACMAGPAQL